MTSTHKNWSEWLVRMGFNMAGKSKKAGRRLLVLKHNRWWFRRAIPAACQKALGRGAFFMENLETSDLKAAQRLRDALERDTSELFEAVLSGKARAAEAMTAKELGLRYREALAEAAEQDTGEDDVNPYAVAVVSAEATAEAFRDETERDAFLDALHGRDDVLAHLEAHSASLAKNGIVARSIKGRQGQIKLFAEWATAQKPALTLDRIDRKWAGRYVAEKLDELHPKTQSQHLLALRGYWTYLAARGLIELPAHEPRNSGWPWNAQQIRNKATRAERGGRDEKERPFTEAEVKTLLYSPYPERMDKDHESQLKDAISLALLSGLRLAEVVKLWAEDVKESEDGAGLIFDIQEGKTDAAARPVPVHPDLMEC